MPKLNSKILIIIAGVILVILIALTLFINSLTKDIQDSQAQPTLIPTGVFESGDSSQVSNSQDKEEQEEPIMSEEEVNRLIELKNKAPIDSADFTIGYFPESGEFFVSTKTPQGEKAFRQYLAANQLTNVLANFSDLFHIGAQPLDQLIKEREGEIANQNQRLEEQLAEQQRRQTTSQQNNRTQNERDTKKRETEKQLTQFFGFLGSLSLDFTGGRRRTTLKDAVNNYEQPGVGDGGGIGELPSPQQYNGGGTPQLKEIMSIVKVISGITWGGICVTSGHMANSEHYYCNAVDLFGSETLLDNTFAKLLNAAKNNELPIHCIIYERYSYSRESNWAQHPYSGASTHDSHIHISGWPSVGGAC